MITYVDLFAGAGGLSEGLSQAGLTGIAHVEADQNACHTLRTREAYRHLRASGNLGAYRDYLRKKISRDELYRRLPDDILRPVIECRLSRHSVHHAIRQIEENLEAAGAVTLDVLVGGPPCQPFALIGRHYNGKITYDNRRWLFREFITILKEFKPTTFVFENVPGLTSMREGAIYRKILKGFDDAGYDTITKVVDSGEYGVLQQRKRLLILGSRRRQAVKLQEPQPCRIEGVVGDALADLPAVEPGADASSAGYSGKAVGYVAASRLRERYDLLTLHMARVQNDRDRQIYRLVAETWHKEKRRLLCSELPDGLRPNRSVDCFRDRFKVVAPDLAHSQTVIAHIASDGHYYIHPDVQQARSITVREAARLQSFPDSYFFEGQRRNIFRQIGNAVPPLLGKAIGSAALLAFETVRPARIPA